MSDSIWIMGLSIDEELHWGAVRIPVQVMKREKKELVQIVTDGSYLRDSQVVESLGPLPDSERLIDLQALLEKQLKKLAKKHSEIFSATRSIGISTIGVLDINNHLLLNIDRKAWKYHGDDKKYLVNFAALINSIFGGRSVKINVHNDAIAKALAEYKEQYASPHRDAVKNLCVAMFHDGVNAGIVHGYLQAGRPLLGSGHHEMGHVCPAPHPADRNFNPAHSGCKLHSDCFVALGAGGRIRRQWNTPLRELRDFAEGPHPWDIIAHYIAHFCWMVFLTIPVDKILLSGSIIFDELLPRVHEKFLALNTYQGAPYIKAGLGENFIDLALLSVEEASMIGAWELARLAAAGERGH